MIFINASTYILKLCFIEEEESAAPGLSRGEIVNVLLPITVQESPVTNLI